MSLRDDAERVAANTAWVDEDAVAIAQAYCDALDDLEQAGWGARATPGPVRRILERAAGENPAVTDPKGLREEAQARAGALEAAQSA